MSNERNSAIQPPYKKIDDHGLDLRAALAGPLLMFLKYGTSQTIDQLVDARKQLSKHIVLERAASLGIDRLMLDAPFVEADAPAAPDRSFGCLNEDIYNGNVWDMAAPGDQPIKVIHDDQIGPNEHRYIMPDNDRLRFQRCIDGNSSQDDVNDFWMGLGLMLGFAWTTVRNLRSDDGHLTFIAQPEGETSTGEAITLDDDPFNLLWDQIVARHMKKGFTPSAQYRDDIMMAFRAGQCAAGGSEIEIDGQMMPADQACEALLAQLDDIRNIARDARDTLKAALDDDDAEILFRTMTIDGEGVE